MSSTAPLDLPPARLLVTGGAGFIGSAVVRQLLDSGHEVVVYDNLSTGRRANVPAGVALLEGDILDTRRLGEAARGVDTVIHLAALVSVVRSQESPGECWTINVRGTRNVLAAAQEAGCRRVVLASSAAVYGNQQASRLAEDAPLVPRSPYAHSKLLNEADAMYYASYMGLPAVNLRFFNVYGPLQDPRSPYSGVIAILLDRALTGEPFVLQGTGEQTRDFIYVDDVAEAIVKASAYVGHFCEIINVGRGETVTLNDLIHLAGKLVGREVNVHYGPPRPGDILHSRADAKKLNSRLGCLPSIGLERGLQLTLEAIHREHTPL